ncbi:TnpA family transposase [Deinococcus metalli]|uniref:Transposase n=1 Tax=Deinococcus metalli TaxID=1141878 RepID=A0A7W8NR37_9DEIO|nr:Tn3 family transposase [Deinococcus metalli]MBB5378516.1 TnpA family transposase [Deinococcus metalli]GHF58271.1 transposase [Deinococcus metalli]
MPVEFLSDEQAARYGQYHQPLTPEQLTRYFYLSEEDHAFIARRRRDRNRLGCAVQLGTLRYLGNFLPEPTRVPDAVAQTLAQQLQVNPAALLDYRRRASTWYEHQHAILQHTGMQPFDGRQAFRLVRWLYAQLATGTLRPSLLFDLATYHPTGHQVVLPGVTVLARLIARVQERSGARTFQGLSRRLSPEQRTTLDALLILPPGQFRTPLEMLRTPPTRVSAPGLVAALARLEQIRATGVGRVGVEDIPEAHLTVLARQAQGAWAQTQLRMADDRRWSTLLVFVQHLERTATDDVLDVLVSLLGTLSLRGEARRRQERLRTLGDLDHAALILQDACRLLLDTGTPDAEVRAQVYAKVGEARLLEAVGTIQALAWEAEQPPDALSGQYSTVRRFLPALLRSVTLDGTPSAKPLLAAWTFLVTQEDTGRSRSRWEDAPRSFVPKVWARRVFPDGQPDRAWYTLCVLDRLQQALKRRGVFAPGSDRYRDPRAQLLQGDAWLAARDDMSRALDPMPDLAAWRAALTEAYTDVQHLAGAGTVTLREEAGHTHVSVSPLDAQLDSPALNDLRTRLALRLPAIELSELLLEVQAFSGFAGAFTPVTAGRTSWRDLPVSICAVLLAQACNIGLKAVARDDVPALTLARLSWVQQTHVRAEGITAANAHLVAAQDHLPLARQWGGGEVASADGLRFVVPVRMIHAGWNSTYFGSQRGVTYYNFTSNQFTSFHGIVIPGTLRDSLFVPSGLLEQQTHLDPRELMTDTHGSSDVIFGLFSLLGYRFNPRLADLGDQRFWRLDRNADYGELNDLSRHVINERLIAEHWEDMLRPVGSLKLGQVKATAVMRTVQRGGSLSGLGRAVAEVGRIEKTLYLLSYVRDDGYRRRILVQLNRGEGRHAVARAVFHGRRGELRQRYREGMEVQLGALGLVVNALVLWNTRYLQHALTHRTQTQGPVAPADIARLSPLLHEHVNMLGRYDFSLPEAVAGGHLRPLRDPSPLQASLEQLS